MSSHPFISHHLFVAAVEHERRYQAKLPRNQAIQDSLHEIVPVELPSGKLIPGCTMDNMTSSPLVRET